MGLWKFLQGFMIGSTRSRLVLPPGYTPSTGAYLGTEVQFTTSNKTRDVIIILKCSR
jgi:hypothetical protein